MFFLERQVKEPENFVSQDVAVLRLDGHNFGKFTKKLAVFDEKFTKTMIDSARETADFIGSKEFFVGSDEATFVIERSYSKNGDLPYGGRKDKLCSLSAAQMTASFIKFSQKNSLVGNGTPIFDARIFDTDRETADHLIDSRKESVYKNAVGTFAWSLFGSKKIEKCSVKERIIMLDDKFNDIPVEELYGTFEKKIMKDIVLREDSRLKIPLEHRPVKGTTVKRQVWEKF